MKPLHLVFALGAFLGSLGLASAQSTISVPDGVLDAGKEYQIDFNGGLDFAGKEITITVDNGDELEPLSESIVIQLNAEGKGSGVWRAPTQGWDSALFNSEDAHEVARVIAN